MAGGTITIDPALLVTAKEIFRILTEQRPEHSFSFTLTQEGHRAIPETIKVAEWGIGGNKPKLKATALEVLAGIEVIEQGMPVNVNLTEYELKSMEEIVAVLEKAIDSHQDGALT